MAEAAKKSTIEVSESLELGVVELLLGCCRVEKVMNKLIKFCIHYELKFQ
jgi:hypothetical protein